ncbi:MAG: type I restriction enzyme HsdR N-terminal domain-containing protein [Desulfosarcina sp.]|nr:type I restriction enzyme HsdR N-terminal domain-containing protein [Desulfosarcina sp.]MBC2745337.1 type I restriction enzyme HsdR N-terminal domain-containing protein [Desulfosarcina sp.]MBC2768242.1 type I restriction enzyme HsdR N-terminal domain-containing protein [Desulfosarcina sp.]
MQEETNPDVIVDFITGQPVSNVGAEANRQQVERYLVEEKGYRREDVIVDAPIDVEIDGNVYRSTVDLVVQVESRPLMAVKCAAGSLGSREREIVSAARLYGTSPMPLAVVSDGSSATVLDAATGKKTGDGLAAIPTRSEAVNLAQAKPPPSVAPDRLAREKLVFRSYDSMNVNVRGRDS